MTKVLGTVRPRSLLILAAASNTISAMNLMSEFGFDANGRTVTVDCVATSGNDRTHVPNSKHYTGDALDLRSKTFPDLDSKRRFIAALAARLGPKYRVQLHDKGTDNEHFHVEYRP